MNEELEVAYFIYEILIIRFCVVQMENRVTFDLLNAVGNLGKELMRFFFSFFVNPDMPLKY